MTASGLIDPPVGAGREPTDRRFGRHSPRRAATADVAAANARPQATAPARWVSRIVNPSAFANGTTSLTAS
jgi:hypothetical protein